MKYPWTGEAVPSSRADMAAAALSLGCDIPAMEAVWEVESSGNEFDPDDASLPRRFEPHKLPNSPLNWRDSLRISEYDRGNLFAAAYSKSPETALRATSWGAPQIMGENFRAAGFDSAMSMVKAMANSGRAQIFAFVSFVKANGLDTHLRAHDWYKFAVGYNGTGQPEVYAKKMEAAYRRYSGGKTSPIILRFGAQGEDVKKLQRLLHLADDGIFGRETEDRVKLFQQAAGLVVDGVVGYRTWAMLQDSASVAPGGPPPSIPSQPTPGEDLADKVKKWSGTATAAAAGATAMRQLFSDQVWEVMSYGIIIGVAIFAASALFRRVRS